jgi:hypothetical protein
VHTEVSAQGQEASHSQDTTRWQLKAPFALDVESQTVDCVNIFGVLFVVGFISFSTLFSKVSAMNVKSKDGGKINVPEAEAKYLPKSSSVDLFWSLADGWKSSNCENLPKAMRGKTQVA